MHSDVKTCKSLETNYRPTFSSQVEGSIFDFKRREKAPCILDAFPTTVGQAFHQIGAAWKKAKVRDPRSVDVRFPEN